jgi:hypothetical protein
MMRKHDVRGGVPWMPGVSSVTTGLGGQPPCPQGVTLAVPGIALCAKIGVPLPVVSGTRLWAFIVPALQAAAGRCWVGETSAKAGALPPEADDGKRRGDSDGSSFSSRDRRTSDDPRQAPDPPDHRTAPHPRGQPAAAGRHPRCSNGTLTLAALAAEAALPRHRLYEHHADLVAEFKATTLTGGPATPGADALRQQLADARERIRHLKASEAQLKAKITTLCAVITEPTHEAKAGNIVAKPARSHRDG